MIKNLLLSLSLGLYAQNAFAWGSMGHQTVGEIAERFLTPEAKLGIADILGPEKLAIAAVWADDVRDDPDFNAFKPYHFISIDSNAPYSSLPEDQHDLRDSMTVLTKYPAIILDPKMPKSVKLVALKYLIHVVGDVHQPMHIGKSSDSGGNSCKLIWDKQNYSLHQVWDGRIIDFDISRIKAGKSPLKNFSFIQYADFLLKNSNLSEEQINSLAAIDYSAWIKESQDLRPKLYPENAPKTFCQDHSTEFPVITEDFKNQSANIARERLVYGGMRLASLLNKIFDQLIPSRVDERLTKEQILEKLNLTNR